MSVKYNEDFKREVTKAYMQRNKSMIEIAADYNLAKSTVAKWAKHTEKNANIKIPL